MDQLQHIRGSAAAQRSCPRPDTSAHGENLFEHAANASDAASSAREMRAVGATEAGSSEETLPGGSVSKTDV